MDKKEIKTSSIYLMHKYWGKKPSSELKKIIEKYTTIGDLVFDPFCGFGGIAIEAVLQNRNVIINDLNPAAVFIANTILSEKINLEIFEKMFKKLKNEYSEFENEWYTFKNIYIHTILRDEANRPIKIRGKEKNTNAIIEIELTKNEIHEFEQKEKQYRIKTWYPVTPLIVNSRISAKEGMKVCDLFSKRSLICQSHLFSLINQMNDSPEKDLFLLSFTSNLANCSKLVPPISSRGDMAQGAWMTGFYIGKTYLDNNVFHYFENRIAKSIKGKKDYYDLRTQNDVYSSYLVINEDAKNLSVESNSVDLVFTDFPYGDTVPYFEQSQLWNSWLNFVVDYENEIVISDSKERNKDINDFENGISDSISEISRILRDNKFFVFTFHSLFGREWSSIVKALKMNNFKFIECDVMLQKTLPPRQLNRAHSIKGDVIAVYQKRLTPCIDDDFYSVLMKNINQACSKKNEFETNDLIIICIKSMLSSNYENADIDFKKIITKYFEIDESNNKWRRKK